MLRTLAIGTLILTGAATVAQADVYRWVDEHGSVHYSDQWVPGSELIKTTHPRTSSSDAGRRSNEREKLQVASDRTTAQLAEENDQRIVQKDTAKARQQQCKEAKERYERAIQARRIYKAPQPAAKDPKAKDQTAQDEERPPDREYLSDADADAFRLQAHKDMVEACGESAK
jgi:hypothetical protein